MIHVSCCAAPGGEPPAQCHCSHRPELVSDPSSSAKQVVGSWNTSVWIDFVSTSLYSPWFSQNRAVSVSSGSIVTRNFSFERDDVILPRFGKASSGLNPWQM